jgi:hypothetical protein
MELKTIMLLSFIFAEIISLLITNNKIKTNKKHHSLFHLLLPSFVFSFYFCFSFNFRKLGLGVIE